MDFLRPILARIIAAFVGALASYLYAKYGFTLDNESQAAIVSTMFAIYGIIYAIVHKGVNSKINPVDAARISTSAATKINADAVADARNSQVELP